MNKYEDIINTLDLYRNKDVHLGYLDMNGNKIEGFVNVLHNNDLYTTIVRFMNERPETFQVYYTDIFSIHGKSVETSFEYEHDEDEKSKVDENDDNSESMETEDEDIISYVGKVDIIETDAEAAKKGATILKDYIKKFGYISENKSYNEFNFTPETEPEWFKNIEHFVSCCTNPNYSNHGDLGNACCIDRRVVSDVKSRIRNTIEMLINNKNVASNDESLILSILPFVKIKRHRCKKSKNRRILNQIISNRGDNVTNVDYQMSDFKKYSVENQLTKGFKSENVAKFYEFAGMILDGCSFKEATKKVGISESGADKWRKRVLGFIEKH